MNKSQIKQIVAEEVKRQRKRVFFEDANPMEPNAPVQAQPQQAAPVPAEPTNAAPTLDVKKSQGIVAGAIKTLMQSGALQGVGPEQVQQMTAAVVASLQTAVGSPAAPAPVAPVDPTAQAPIAAPEVDDSAEEDPEFDDQVAHDKEANELDDQNQYDPDLDKQLSGGDEEEAPAPEEEEPLFEAKDMKRLLKMI